MRTGSVLFLVVVVLLVAIGSPRAEALTRDEAKCRGRIAKAVRKLGVTLIKESSRCHAQRLGGELPVATDCNQAAQLPGINKVSAAAARVEAAALKHCSDVAAPAAVGYDVCPSPCGSIAISDFSSVSQCVTCVAQAGGESLLAGILGNPASPSSVPDVPKCQTKIARAFLKYANTRLKVQQTCQFLEDQTAAGLDCLSHDPNGRLAKARTKAEAKVAQCSSAAISLLDSCSTTVAGARTCVADAAETASDALFSVMFATVGAGGDGYHQVEVPQPDGSTDTMTIYAVSPDPAVHGPGPYPVVVYGHGQSHLMVANCDPSSVPTSAGREAEVQPLADAGYLAVFVRYRNRGPGAPSTGAIRFRDHWVFDSRGILAAAQWARVEHGSGTGDVAFLGSSFGTWTSLWAASTHPALADLKAGLTTRTVILAAETANHFANSRGRYDEALASSSPTARPIGVVAASAAFANLASASMGMTQVEVGDLAAGEPLGDVLRNYLTEQSVEILRTMYFEPVPAGADCGAGYGNRPPGCSNACMLASYEALYGDIEDFGEPEDYFLPAGVDALTYWDPSGGATDPGPGVTDPAMAAMRASSPAYAATGLETPRALSLLNEADNHYDADARALLVAKLTALGASPVGAPINVAPECGHSSYLDEGLDCGINEILAELSAAFP